MKILSLSLDKKIFEQNSAVRDRQIEYGKLCEEMNIIVLGKNNSLAQQEYNLSGNVKAHGFDGNGLARFIGAYKLAKKIILANKVDLITTQDPFVMGLFGWLIKRKFEIPLQLQIHTDFLSTYFWKESLKNKIYVLLAKFLLPRVDGIRVVSKRIKKSLVVNNLTSADKIMVLPIFVDAEKIRNAPMAVDLRKKYPQFDFMILMASRLSKEKNIGLAVEVIAKITKKYNRAGLIIVGEGQEGKNLKSQISNLKISENIIIEPWSDDLAPYYKTADLFLLTSNYEGYGLAVAEAIAVSLPVVMTDVGCAGELVIDNENGLIAPVGDKNKLVEAIIKMIADKILYQQLKEGVAKVSEKFISKEEYLDLYKKSWEVCKNTK